MIFLNDAIIAQQNGVIIKLDAKITEVESMGERLNVVKVKLYENGVIIDSAVTQDGRYFHDLDTGSVYKVLFSKSGYVSKHLIVSTTEAPISFKSKSKLKVDISLFKKKPNMDFSFLDKKPMGVAEINPISRKLEWDIEYTRIMVEKIIEATLSSIEN